MGTKTEKCLHYDTCKDSTITMCGKKWNENGCLVEVPMTNADYICSMTDEELKDFICNNTDCRRCRFEDWTGCLLEKWLKQPKENNNG